MSPELELKLAQLSIMNTKFMLFLADENSKLTERVIALSPNQKDAARELSRTEQMSASVAETRASVAVLAQLFDLK
jgi:hypothetical protein